MVYYFRVYEPGGQPALLGTWLPSPFHRQDEATPPVQLNAVPPVQPRYCGDPTYLNPLFPESPDPLIPV